MESVKPLHPAIETKIDKPKIQHHENNSINLNSPVPFGGLYVGRYGKGHHGKSRG